MRYKENFITNVRFISLLHRKCIQQLFRTMKTFKVNVETFSVEPLFIGSINFTHENFPM